MFRTRDFILIFSTVVFLVVAIGTTVLTQNFDQAPAESVFVEESVDKGSEVVVYSPETVSRSERLKDMKAKIAASEAVISDPVTFENGLDDVDQPEESDESGSESFAVMLCDNYSPYNGLWVTLGLKVETVEGSPLVYREVLTDQIQGSTTVKILKTEPVLQLPVQSPNASNPNCIGTDVVGVALDGSLIRNNELGLYGVFGNETLIGYALDGFPIYGAGDLLVDSCGGINSVTGYRYSLSTERETIINCFAGIPASL